MAVHHVRCIGTTDEAVDRALKLFEPYLPQARRGFSAYGYASDEAMVALDAAGVLVEEIPDETTLAWLEPTEDAAAVASEPAPSEPYQRIAASEQVYVVQFRGQLFDEEQQVLDSHRVVLGSYVPEFAYKAMLSAEQLERVRSLPFVKRVQEFTPGMTLRRFAIPHSEQAGLASGFSSGVTNTQMFHVRCHDAADIPALAQVLSGDPRVSRTEAGRNRIRISVLAEHADSLRRELAQLAQVSVVEPFDYPKPFTAFVRRDLALEIPGQAPLPWRGNGQIVGVADSGVDSQHPDLRARLKKVIERVPPEGPDDPYGHGTHVCSIIAGDGSASGGELCGIAPKAELVVQSIRDDLGRFSGVPVDMGDLFQEAYDLGARVYNISWGFASTSFYTTDSYELDKFVYDHPDFLIVVAAGNEGQQPVPLAADDQVGRIGYSSIAAPATSKNSLCVGACCSSRGDGPYEGQTWKQYRGHLPGPKQPLTADELINGKPDLLAAFSSRGPTDDERVKPDLVAPGTVVLAAKSSATTPAFPHPKFEGRYRYESGTSMAAPVLAGAAAIVRQYYIEVAGRPAPSAALLKATLINGCEWLFGQTVEDPHVGQPNFHQGFGRINLRKSLPLPDNPSGVELCSVDVGRTDAGALNSNKPAESAWRKRIQVAAGAPLSITLCWTDHPAHGLQNHLELILQPPTGTPIVGNPNLRRQPWAKTDRFNNAQRIEIAEPEAGTYGVIVNARNTPFGPQGFSLAASGRISSDFF